MPRLPDDRATAPRARKIFLMICRIPFRPFDYMVKAGKTGRSKIVTSQVNRAAPTGEWRKYAAIFGYWLPPR